MNNWNEDRKKELLEIQYLKRLKIDLGSDTVYYNSRISDSEEVISKHREFLNLLYQKQQDSIDDILELFSNWKPNSEHVTTQNSTYIELT